MHESLSKSQKQALRAAAKLAHERDDTMSREDRDVHYLDANNDSLPIVVGGAVAHGYIRIDEVGEAARALVERVAGSLKQIFETPRTPSPPEEDPYDPKAVVSLSAIVQELDLISQDSTLFLNTRTGEAEVRGDEDEDWEESLDDDESDDSEWIALLSGRNLDEYDSMRRFARHARPAASRDLEEALHGRGAHRRFREVVHRRGLEKEWEEYRTERRRSTVRFALEKKGIAFRR